MTNYAISDILPYQVYIASSDESLKALAKRLGVDLRATINLNNKQEEDLIEKGDVAGG